MIGYGSECCEIAKSYKDIQYWDAQEFDNNQGRWCIVNSNHNTVDIFYCPFCGKKL